MNINHVIANLTRKIDYLYDKKADAIDNHEKDIKEFMLWKKKLEIEQFSPDHWNEIWTWYKSHNSDDLANWGYIKEYVDDLIASGFNAETLNELAALIVQLNVLDSARYKHNNNSNLCPLHLKAMDVAGFVSYLQKFDDIYDQQLLLFIPTSHSEKGIVFTDHGIVNADSIVTDNDDGTKNIHIWTGAEPRKITPNVLVKIIIQEPESYVMKEATKKLLQKFLAKHSDNDMITKVETNTIQLNTGESKTDTIVRKINVRDAVADDGTTEFAFFSDDLPLVTHPTEEGLKIGIVHAQITIKLEKGVDPQVNVHYSQYLYDAPGDLQLPIESLIILDMLPPEPYTSRYDNFVPYFDFWEEQQFNHATKMYSEYLYSTFENTQGYGLITNSGLSVLKTVNDLAKQTVVEKVIAYDIAVPEIMDWPLPQDLLPYNLDSFPFRCSLVDVNSNVISMQDPYISPKCPIIKADSPVGMPSHGIDEHFKIKGSKYQKLNVILPYPMVKVGDHKYNITPLARGAPLMIPLVATAVDVNDPNAEPVVLEARLEMRPRMFDCDLGKVNSPQWHFHFGGRSYDGFYWTDKYAGWIREGPNFEQRVEYGQDGIFLTNDEWNEHNNCVLSATCTAYPSQVDWLGRLTIINPNILPTQHTFDVALSYNGLGSEVATTIFQMRTAVIVDAQQNSTSGYQSDWYLLFTGTEHNVSCHINIGGNLFANTPKVQNATDFFSNLQDTYFYSYKGPKEGTHDESGYSMIRKHDPGVYGTYGAYANPHKFKYVPTTVAKPGLYYGRSNYYPNIDRVFDKDDEANYFEVIHTDRSTLSGQVTVFRDGPNAYIGMTPAWEHMYDFPDNYGYYVTWTHLLNVNNWDKNGIAGQLTISNSTSFTDKGLRMKFLSITGATVPELVLPDGFKWGTNIGNELADVNSLLEYMFQWGQQITMRVANLEFRVAALDKAVEWIYKKLQELQDQINYINHVMLKQMLFGLVDIAALVNPLLGAMVAVGLNVYMLASSTNANGVELGTEIAGLILSLIAMGHSAYKLTKSSLTGDRFYNKDTGESTSISNTDEEASKLTGDFLDKLEGNKPAQQFVEDTISRQGSASEGIASQLEGESPGSFTFGSKGSDIYEGHVDNFTTNVTSNSSGKIGPRDVNSDILSSAFAQYGAEMMENQARVVTELKSVQKLARPVEVSITEFQPVRNTVEVEWVAVISADGVALENKYTYRLYTLEKVDGKYSQSLIDISEADYWKLVTSRRPIELTDYDKSRFLDLMFGMRNPFDQSRKYIKIEQINSVRKAGDWKESLKNLQPYIHTKTPLTIDPGPYLSFYTLACQRVSDVSTKVRMSATVPLLYYENNFKNRVPKIGDVLSDCPDSVRASMLQLGAEINRLEG